MQAVTHAERHQSVPGGVELDLVKPLAVAVVATQDGWVDVREPAPLERVAAELDAERRGALLPGGTALAPQRLYERPVLREEVVALERRRLVAGGADANCHGAIVTVAPCHGFWQGVSVGLLVKGARVGASSGFSC